MSFASLTAGQAILGASALSTGGSILSGLLGENAAQTAAQQATAGELTGLGAVGGAENNAFNHRIPRSFAAGSPLF